MSTVIPFGKYKGHTVAEIAARDRQYLLWLANQPDLPNRHRSIYDEIVGLRAPDDNATPEHNRLQARFLDDVLVGRVVRFYYGSSAFRMWEEHQKTLVHHVARLRQRLLFEEFRQSLPPLGKTYDHVEYNKRAYQLRAKRDEIGDKNLDIHAEIITPESVRAQIESTAQRIDLTTTSVDQWMKIYGKKWFEQFTVRFEKIADVAIKPEHGSPVLLELKPQIGDDYPNVLRQALRQKEIVRRTYERGYVTVIYEQCRSATVSNEQIRKIFKASDIDFQSLSDVEAWPAIH